MLGKIRVRHNVDACRLYEWQESLDGFVDEEEAAVAVNEDGADTVANAVANGNEDPPPSLPANVTVLPSGGFAFCLNGVVRSICGDGEN